MKRTSLTGQVFGRWTVVSAAPTRTTPSGSLKAYWVCVCSCGAQEEVRAEHLLKERTQSCGCLKRELAAAQKLRHGGSDSLLYDVWTQMVQRCENARNKQFARYGGRGITVCDRWHDFALFRADNIEHYQPGLTIDREKNDGNYEPGNCRWVTNKVNGRNRPKTLVVEFEGKSVPLNELAERFGLKTGTVYSRYRLKGWPLARALETRP